MGNDAIDKPEKEKNEKKDGNNQLGRSDFGIYLPIFRVQPDDPGFVFFAAAGLAFDGVLNGLRYGFHVGSLL